jgi:dUTP pyrophosphatase
MKTLRYYSTADHGKPLAAATSGAAGLDIRVLEDVELKPADHRDINTGLHVEIPRDHVGIVVPRSSLGRKGLRLGNTVGIIDSDYRGEIILNCHCDRNKAIRMTAGDRVAQMLILPVTKVYTQAVKSLDELTTTTRGTAGFGSTGVR